jgi:hypothetical protein
VEVAQLVLEYLKALVWPAVALTAILLFRHRLHDLLERITSFEGPGGVKANFTARLTAVKERLEQVQELEQVHEEEQVRQDEESLRTPTARDGKQVKDETSHARPTREPAPVPVPAPGPDAPRWSREELARRLAAIDEARRMYSPRAIDLEEMAAQVPNMAVLEAWKTFEHFLAQVAEAIGGPAGRNPTATQRRVINYLGDRDIEGAISELRRLRNSVVHENPKLTPYEAARYTGTVAGLITTVHHLARRRLLTTASEGHNFLG